jgi:hypothetical protein
MRLYIEAMLQLPGVSTAAFTTNAHEQDYRSACSPGRAPPTDLQIPGFFATTTYYTPECGVR